MVTGLDGHRLGCQVDLTVFIGFLMRSRDDGNYREFTSHFVTSGTRGFVVYGSMLRPSGVNDQIS